MVRRPPVVSVVIPCYNYARYLPACVDSVVEQAGVEVRVLIIDDSSTDDSSAVAEELARRDARVATRRHAENRGHIATYNEGLLEWADGDYVVLLSADDLLAPGALGRAVDLMESHPRVGMVYGRSLDFSDDVPRVDHRFAGTTVHDGRRWLARRAREAANVVSTPTAVVRTSVQRRVGGYDPELPHAGDFEMWLRVAGVADVGYVRGSIQAFYRVHPTSMSQQIYKDRLADILQRRAVMDSIFSKHGDALAAAGVARDATYRTLASEPLWLACRAYEKGNASQVPITDWVEFARQTHPDLGALPAYRALRRRQRLGERLCHRTQLFAVTTVVRRLQDLLWWERWKRFGG